METVTSSSRMERKIGDAFYDGGETKVIEYLKTLTLEEIKSNKSFAFRCVARHGYISAVRFLLQPYYCTREENGLIITLKTIEEFYDTINACNGEALEQAVLRGHNDVVEFLLEHGANSQIYSHIMGCSIAKYMEIYGETQNGAQEEKNYPQPGMQIV
jgi:hypothetical protein